MADAIADQNGSGGGNRFPGSWGLLKSGVGTLVLGNSGNSFTRGISVAGGTLSIAADGALGIGGTVALGDATSLALTGGGLYTYALTVTGNPTVNLPPVRA